MRVLIIGLGSIASKHINALKLINAGVEIYALRTNPTSKSDMRVINLFNWSEVPGDIDFVIISNPTSMHYRAIQQAAELRIPLFIEKPPLADLKDAESLVSLVENSGVLTYIAFNFRFHPVINWLKKELPNKRILEIQVYCGSFLPDWRQGQDYRQIYSAKKEMGGGVHLDLIHELDYLKWIFGMPEKISGFISKISELEMDAPDCAHYWLTYKKMNVSVILNYYRKDAKRQLEIVFEDETWIADLLKFTVRKVSGELLFSTEADILKLYEDQMRYFIDCINTQKPLMNNLEDSIKTLKMALGQ